MAAAALKRGSAAARSSRTCERAPRAPQGGARRPPGVGASPSPLAAPCAPVRAPWGLVPSLPVSRALKSPHLAPAAPTRRARARCAATCLRLLRGAAHLSCTHPQHSPLCAPVPPLAITAGPRPLRRGAGAPPPPLTRLDFGARVPPRPTQGAPPIARARTRLACLLTAQRTHTRPSRDARAAALGGDSGHCNPDRRHRPPSALPASQRWVPKPLTHLPPPAGTHPVPSTRGPSPRPPTPGSNPPRLPPLARQRARCGAARAAHTLSCGRSRFALLCSFAPARAAVQRCFVALTSCALHFTKSLGSAPFAHFSFQSTT